LEEDEMRLTVSDEGMKTPHVCSFISIEAEDGEKRGHSLSILPRERRTPLYLVKARSPPWRERRPLPPSEDRPCRRSGPFGGQGGRQLGRPCHLLQIPSKSGKQISWDEGCGIAPISVRKTTEMRLVMVTVTMWAATPPRRHPK
jgi:hypothetical protein